MYKVSVTQLLLVIWHGVTAWNNTVYVSSTKLNLKASGMGKQYSTDYFFVVPLGIFHRVFSQLTSIMWLRNELNNEKASNPFFPTVMQRMPKCISSALQRLNKLLIVFLYGKEAERDKPSSHTGSSKKHLNLICKLPNTTLFTFTLMQLSQHF